MVLTQALHLIIILLLLLLLGLLLLQAMRLLLIMNCALLHVLVSAYNAAAVSGSLTATVGVSSAYTRFQNCFVELVLAAAALAAGIQKRQLFKLSVCCYSSHVAARGQQRQALTVCKHR
jgi:hypothetical protein